MAKRLLVVAYGLFVPRTNISLAARVGAAYWAVGAPHEPRSDL